MKKKNLIGMLLLIPAAGLIFILSIYPLGVSLKMSFYKQILTGIEAPKFIGFSNYIYIFRNFEYIEALFRTIWWALGTLTVQSFLGLGVALLLNQKFIGRTFVRGASLLPYFLGGVAVWLTWRWMYSDIYGVINEFLLDIHLIKHPIMWLSSPGLAIWALMITSAWKWFPFISVNILARLQSINPDLYDAAKIDGANSWRGFVHITLPQVKGVFLVIVLLRGIWMFNKFTPIWIMTAGGPAGATTTLPILTYTQGFNTLRMGRATSITATLFVIVLIFTLFYLIIFKPSKQGAT